MGIEIDFLMVGEGEKGGDAISIRLWKENDTQNQLIIAIDGGTRDSGDRMVKHINNYYGTNKVDLAILTHPDCDHASGMREILEQMEVKTLAMHLPWEHAENIKHLFENNNINTTALKKYVKENLETAHEVYKLANEKSIPIIEPFSDNGDFGILKILSPSISFYETLLPDFTCTPDAKQSLFVELYKSAKETVTTFVDEQWNIETLSNPDDSNTNSGTRPENNSSVVFYLEFNNSKFLFTADAGVTALYEAYIKASSLGIDLKTINFIQIPHHGSKRNVGPNILDLIVGNILDSKTFTKSGYISCPKKGEPKHPSKKVMNAFTRRGVKVYTTANGGKYHFEGINLRSGWSAAIPEQLFDKVEKD